MRTLERNKIKLWIVEPLTKIPILDSDGNLTGEFSTGFSVPKLIHLALYPSNGNVISQLFGKDYSCDMISVSTNIVLNKDTYLFLNIPTSNYDTTYDYVIDNISKSLNSYSYGLKARI